MMASDWGNPEAIKILINAKSDVNVRDLGGHTPLMVASLKGNVRAMKVLMGAGAQANLQDNEGDTALITAIKWYQTGAINYLVRARNFFFRLDT